MRAAAAAWPATLASPARRNSTGLLARLEREGHRKTGMSIRKAPVALGRRDHERQAAPRQDFVLVKHVDRQSRVDQGTEYSRQRVQPFARRLMRKNGRIAVVGRRL